MTTKLTLSVNPDAISRIKRHAASRRTSVSRLFETYVYEITDDTEGNSTTPVLDRLRGLLSGAEIVDPKAEHRSHLAEKHSK